jgi:sodium/potassium-transporting ATPase subunit alpha
VIQRQIHNLALAEVFASLRSRPGGLTAAEVAERQAELGPNTLDPPPRWGWLRTLATQLTNLFSLLLYASAALCFVAERMQPGEHMAVLGWALAGVALLNAAFTFAQTIRAEQAMRALQDLLPQRVTVTRADGEQAVPIATLVPGDVIHLAEGDRVPADARLIAASDLLANNAPLTGESRHASLARPRCPPGGWSTRPTWCSPAARSSAARGARWCTRPGAAPSSARSRRCRSRCGGRRRRSSARSRGWCASSLSSRW